MSLAQRMVTAGPAMIVDDAARSLAITLRMAASVAQDDAALLALAERVDAIRYEAVQVMQSNLKFAGDIA